MNDPACNAWITVYIRVDSGRIVKEVSAAIGAQVLVGKTLDEVAQWVLSDGGDIYPVGAQWHTCSDWPSDPCYACKSPQSEPCSYGVVVRATAPLTKPGGFLEMIDRVSAHLSRVS
jgi:hypothetical protein